MGMATDSSLADLLPTAAGTITVRSAYGGEALDFLYQFLWP